MKRIRTYSPRSVFAVVAFTVGMSGCLSPGGDDLVATGSPVAVPTNAPVENASLDADLYFRLERKWEDQGEYEEETLLCTVPKGSADTVNATCNITLPEATMYFSKFRFTWGSTNNDKCKVMVFRPYYFLGSVGAGFTPYWNIDQSSPETCNTSPTPASCYMGPARYLISGFPLKTSSYILSAQIQEASLELESASKSELTSNRLMSNNYTTPAVAIPNEYIANSMQPYQVECRDQWHTLRHRITITIADEDEDGGEDPGGPEDHFSDWQ